MIRLDEALKLLNLETPFDICQLKDAYRREVKQWHPDLNPDRTEEATEYCKMLNNAYDLLEAAASVQCLDQENWNVWVAQRLKRWEKEFKRWWREAYIQTKEGLHPGLHFNTCISNFRRGAIDPRPEWFKNCLFKDTVENRICYREHLLKIAPNQKLKEEWAKKYFDLEFGESEWVFYLPASIALLTAK